MLNLYPTPPAASDAASAPLQDCAWIDLLEPTPEEIARVEAALGFRVPSRDELSEIELSSRIRLERGVLYMSAPLVARSEGGLPFSTPTGFILCQKACLTVRFAQTGAFEQVAEELRTEPRVDPADVFVRVLEAVVDRCADLLEMAADQLNTASHGIFRGDDAARAKLTRETDTLRKLMTDVGRASEKMSRVRHTLVCIERIAQFAADRGKDWIAPPALDRLGAVRADASSLEQFEENLLSRVQLLQDAATAFISIEQNDVVKVLTIASVAGIPPVLVVGVYGMNFKVMPELSWAWGYPYALALIVVTTAIPLIWFKVKNWM